MLQVHSWLTSFITLLMGNECIASMDASLIERTFSPMQVQDNGI